MRRMLKRWVLLVLGWSFVALGVAGLFLPFLQGILMLLIGLSILSGEYAWAHNLLMRLRKRFPLLSRRLNEAGVRARTWLKRIAWPGSDNAQG